MQGSRWNTLWLTPSLLLNSKCMNESKLGRSHVLIHIDLESCWQTLCYETHTCVQVTTPHLFKAQGMEHSRGIWVVLGSHPQLVTAFVVSLKQAQWGAVAETRRCIPKPHLSRVVWKLNLLVLTQAIVSITCIFIAAFFRSTSRYSLVIDFACELCFSFLWCF